MEDRKELIFKLKKATETLRQLQADILVMKEYISRYLENEKFGFSFVGEEGSYNLTSEQLMKLLEPYKV